MIAVFDFRMTGKPSFKQLIGEGVHVDFFKDRADYEKEINAGGMEVEEGYTHMVEDGKMYRISESRNVKYTPVR